MTRAVVGEVVGAEWEEILLGFGGKRERVVGFKVEGLRWVLVGSGEVFEVKTTKWGLRGSWSDGFVEAKEVGEGADDGEE